MSACNSFVLEPEAWGNLFPRVPMMMRWNHPVFYKPGLPCVRPHISFYASHVSKNHSKVSRCHHLLSPHTLLHSVAALFIWFSLLFTFSLFWPHFISHPMICLMNNYFLYICITLPTGRKFSLPITFCYCTYVKSAKFWHH